MRRQMRWGLISLAVMGLLTTAQAQERRSPDDGGWLRAADAFRTSGAAANENSTTQPASVDPLRQAVFGGDEGLVLPARPEWRKPLPIGVTVEYALMSDFICRKGFNLSEFPGEGRERPNHQLLVAPWVSTKDVLGKGTDFGTFSFPTWFEFYDGQPHLTPQSQDKLQEFDFMPTWTYAIPKTPLTFSFTYDYYDLPRLRDSGLSHDASQGNELWFGLALDDSCLFGQPIFSPWVTYVQDVDDIKGAWFDFGIKHDFTFAKLGYATTPVLKDLTLTPAIVFGLDHHYVDKIAGTPLGTHLATINYGLTVRYDLSGAFNIPKQFGDFYIKGMLNFKEQTHHYDHTGFYPVLRDELYGGMAVGWDW
jgi:hypothetical protein